MNFLELKDKHIVVFGVANRRSVAYAIWKLLDQAGARVIHVVKDETVREKVTPLLGEIPILTCNVENEEEILRLPEKLGRHCSSIDGLVHSIAFADYTRGFCPFHETMKDNFLQAMEISCFSLTQVTNTLKEMLSKEASVVTISISTTRMASENYGYMGPIKAALDSSVVFLAKSLSTSEERRRVRVNAVGSGLLKTSSSAGIPGYIDSYLYAEQVIPRRKALAVSEVANTAVFLLSRRSSGINAQTVIVDAGMSVNYFDRGIVRRIAGEQLD